MRGADHDDKCAAYAAELEARLATLTAALALGDALASACKSSTRWHDQEHVTVERDSWAEIQDAALAFQIERDRIALDAAKEE